MAMSPAQVTDFVHQSRTGGSWNDFADAFKHGPQHFFERVGNEFTNPKSQLSNEFNNPNSELRHDIVPGITKAASALAPVANFIVPGSGVPIAAAAQGINAVNSIPSFGPSIPQMLAGRGKLGLARRFPVGTLRLPAAGSGKLGRTRRYAKGTLRLPARATSAMAGSGRFGPRGMRRVVSARRGNGKLGDYMKLYSLGRAIGGSTKPSIMDLYNQKRNDGRVMYNKPDYKGLVHGRGGARIKHRIKHPKKSRRKHAKK
jgi:hypothetical protein